MKKMGGIKMSLKDLLVKNGREVVIGIGKDKVNEKDKFEYYVFLTNNLQSELIDYDNLYNGFVNN